MMIYNYSINFDKIINKIKSSNPKKILLQLPDGFRYHADLIVDEFKKQLEKKNIKNVGIYIWLGSNYGSCDIPYFTKDFGIDIIINIGHARWV